MALLALQTSKVGGTALTFTAAGAGGDTFTSGQKALIVRNASGAAITATVVTPGTDKYALARPDITSVSIPLTTGVVIIGPFPSDLEDPATGLVTVTYSATASVTVALVAI
jgi:hypothetical protein